MNEIHLHFEYGHDRTTPLKMFLVGRAIGLMDVETYQVMQVLFESVPPPWGGVFF